MIFWFHTNDWYLALETTQHIEGDSNKLAKDMEKIIMALIIVHTLGSQNPL